MNADSAAGPDGYNGFFYLICWDIIKLDFFEAVSEFFAGGMLTKAWTSTISFQYQRWITHQASSSTDQSVCAIFA